jgi:ABC-2 type transport system permease protein
MFKTIKKRYRYSFILLRQLVATDFKLRYQGSVLGYMWSLLRPLAIFVILYVVFTRFLRIGDNIPHYPVYLLLGIVLWNFFVEVTTGSVAVIVAKGDLMRKINFPKYVIILSGSVSALINLMLNLLVVLLFMFINGVDFRLAGFIFPILIVELFMFAMSIGFFLSTAFVRFRDVGYIWEVITQAAFYATPILYPLSLVPVRYAKILILNPIAQIIQDSRYVLISDQTQTISSLYSNSLIRLIPLAIVAATVALSIVYFKKRSRYFAEEV